MMRFSSLAIYCCMLLLASLLVGCSSNSSSDSKATGMVIGKISQNNSLAQTRVASGIVVRIDGSNLSAEVNVDGTFQLRGVPAGIHTLIVSSGQAAAALVVEVAAGQQTDVGLVELRDAGQIAGLVTTTITHAPVAQALVTVTPIIDATTDERPIPVRTTITNDSGSYTVDALPTGSYLVTIDKIGYLSGTLSLAVNIGATTIGDISLTAIDSTNTGTVAGVVYEKDANGASQPLGGAFVVLRPANWVYASTTPRQQPLTALNGAGQAVIICPLPPNWKEYYSYSNADGSYQIDGIPAGIYRAAAYRPGFISSEQTVTVQAAQTLKLDFTLPIYVQKIGTVTGIVTDANTGKPLAGVTVSAGFIDIMPMSTQATGNRPDIVPPGGISPIRVFAITDAQGHYTLKVPVETCIIYAYLEGYESQSKSVSIVENGTVTADMALVPLVTNPNITVTLSGVAYIIDSSAIAVRKPAPGVTVYAIRPEVTNWVNEIMAPTLNNSYSTITNEQGAYKLSLPSDDYLIYAKKEGAFSDTYRLRLYSDTVQDITLKAFPIPVPGPVKPG